MAEIVSEDLKVLQQFIKQSSSSRDKALPYAIIRELDEHMRRFYKADGTFEVMPTMEAVLIKRRQAATLIDAQSKLIDQMIGSMKVMEANAEAPRVPAVPAVPRWPSDGCNRAHPHEFQEGVCDGNVFRSIEKHQRWSRDLQAWGTKGWEAFQAEAQRVDYAEAELHTVRTSLQEANEQRVKMIELAETLQAKFSAMRVILRAARLYITREALPTKEQTLKLIDSCLHSDDKPVDTPSHWACPSCGATITNAEFKINSQLSRVAPKTTCHQCHIVPVKHFLPIWRTQP